MKAYLTATNTVNLFRDVTRVRQSFLELLIYIQQITCKIPAKLGIGWFFFSIYVQQTKHGGKKFPIFEVFVTGL